MSDVALFLLGLGAGGTLTTWGYALVTLHELREKAPRS